MSAAKIDKWRCLACRGGVSKASFELESATSSQVEPSDSLAQLSMVHQKLDLLLSLKETVESLKELHPKVDSLLSLRQTVDTMRDTIATMQESLTFFSSEYDILVKATASQYKAIKELQSETITLRSTVLEQAREIQKLKADQNDTDQASRLCNMEIHGIPFSPRENLVDLMTGLAGKLNIESFQLADVVAAHRLPAKPGTVPPLLIRFSSVPLKERWMSFRGRAGSLSREDSHPKIYFNDNLTESNRKLFWMARTRGKEKGFKFVWVRHGKILAKQTQSSPLLRITSTDALEQIV